VYYTTGYAYDNAAGSLLYYLAVLLRYTYGTDHVHGHWFSLIADVFLSTSAHNQGWQGVVFPGVVFGVF
jgi:hypothetical protein